MKFKTIIFIFLLGTSLMSYAKKNTLEIRTNIDMKYAFCDIKTNGVTGVDNRGSAMEGEGAGTTSTNSLILLENGTNTVTIEMGALGWFSEQDIPSEERNKFDPKAYCKIKVQAIDYGLGTLETLATMDIRINAKGEPEAYIDDKIDNTVIAKKITAPETTIIKKDRLLNGEPDLYSHPKNMPLYQFNKELTVSNIPKWSWVDAQPYTGTPEQLELLKQAYEEMWQAFNQQDIATIKRIYTPGAEAWAISTRSTPDKIFASYEFDDIFQRKNSKAVPINWDNFKVISMNKGRLVRMVYKETLDYSPLVVNYTNYQGEERMSYFSPIFSLINGKFIPVI